MSPRIPLRIPSHPRFTLTAIAFAALGAAFLWLSPGPAVEAQSGTAILVDVAADRRAIDPRIYGVNWASTAQLSALNAPIHRWGGNSVTRYNWQVNADNRGSDWYYQSIPGSSATAGAAADSFIQDSFNGGSEPMMTIPLIGWVAKVGPSRSKLASFSAAKYGAQQDCDWSWYPDACNGIRTDGTKITNNDPNDANTPTTPEIQKQWVQHLVTRWGGAASGGLKYYIYDNEPTIWFATHRDVRPVGVRMTEYRDAVIAYGTAIRQAEPNARLVGPEVWGWSAYFASGYDQQYASDTGCWSCSPDRDANGGADFLPWLLAQLRQHEISTGVRLLDVFTVHFYPQSGEFGSDTSTSMQQRRNRSTRSLWDPNYTDESWIGDRVRLIPRLKEWVNAYYPGLEIGITEYNWGAESHINGATTQADILGIFGREGLNVGTLWTAPGSSTPMFKAMQMYRNYDGASSTFGDTSVRATGPNPDSLAVFAAERSSDGALTVMAINKVTTSNLVNLSLANFSAGPAAQVWQLTSSNSITRLADATVSGGAISATLPAQSITLFVVPAAATTPSLSVNDVTVTEGNAGTTNATFTVTLSAAASSTVTVNYATANGTATAGSDYTAASGTLTFTAGQTSKTVSVPVTGDATIENNETFVLNLSGASGATIADAQGQGTITNDDFPALAINDVTVTEGNSGTTNAVFTVTLSATAPFTVTVNYATANGTATAPGDYAAQTGNLTYTSGQTSKTITVAVVGDTTTEPNETFTVTLSSAAGATIADGTGQGTINNDDGGTLYQVGPGRTYTTPQAVVGLLNPGDVVEVDGNATYPGDLTFTRPGTAANPITIRGITVSGKRPLLSGGTNTVHFRTDVIGQGADHYVFDNFEVTGGSNRCVYHQSDDLTLRNLLVRDCLNQGILGADWGSGSLTLEHSEVRGSGSGTSGHQIYMANDQDAYPTAVFRMRYNWVHDSVGGNNVKSRAARNEIYYNRIEGAYYHELELIGADPACCGEDAAREDSDVVGNLLVKRGPNASFSVVRFGGDGTGQSWGRYRFVNNTVIVAGTGAVFRLFDGLESVEMHNNVIHRSGGPVTVTRTVEAVWSSGEQMSGSNNWITTGSTNVPAAWTGTLTGSDPGFVNATGGDYTPATGSPLLNAANPSPTTPPSFPFPSPLFPPAYHPPGTPGGFGTPIPRPTAGVLDIGAFESSATPPLPTLSINDVTVTEGNSGTTNATFTVTLSAASTSTVTVNYATANGTATAGSDYTAASGTLTFTAGQTSKTITVAVTGDTTVESNETFFVNLTNPSGATIADAQGQGTITNDDTAPLPTLSINDVTVTEGNSGTTNATFTVTLSAASTSTVTVNYVTANGTATAGSDYTATSGTLTFTAGPTSKTITVAVTGDTTVESNETFFVNLTSPSGATIADAQGQGTITNDDIAPLPTLSINDVTVTEGNSGATNATFTVTLSAASTSTVTVNHATANGTATAGSDYTAASGTLTFTAGQTSRTIAVAVIGDTTVEPNETFVVNLTSPSGATIADAQGQATITNDDTSSAPVPVAWVETVGVQASGSSLTKTAAAGWGNAGAVSTQQVASGGGYVEFTASESNTFRMIGLSNGNQDASYQDIDFAIYLMNGTTLIYEKGINRGNGGAYASGDVFRVAASGSVVEYSRNGTVFYTSSQTPVYPLLVDASLYTQGSTLSLVMISGNSAPPPPEAVVWTSLVGVEASGSSLTKTAAAGWGNAGAVSTQQITSGGGYVEFTASESNTFRMIGLSNGNQDASYQDIDFAIYLMNGTTLIYEKGINRGNGVAYASGDVFRVAAAGSAVEYSRNGTVFYTSSQTPVYPLLVDASLYTQGATLSVVVMSESSAPPPPEAVVWTSLVGVEATGSSLAKTAGAGWGNAGAVSTQQIMSGSGYVEFTASEANTFRMIGLSSGNQDASYQDIDFAIYLMNGTTLIYEKGINRGNGVAYASGDVFRVAVAGGVVQYSKNGTVIYTSSQTPAYPLLVDSSFYTLGSTATNVVISGSSAPPPPPPGTQAVVWTTLVGVTATGHSLTKTSGAGWDAGAVSTQQINSGDGYVEFTASEATTFRMIGLSKGNTNATYGDIDFAIYLMNGTTSVYEKSVNRGSGVPYVAGDVFRVAVVGGSVRYSKNGVVFYTSSQAPAYPLLIDTSLYTQGATLSFVVISGGS